MSDEKPYEQLISPDALAGKTVAKAMLYGGDLVIAFDDRTFIRVGIDHGYEPGDTRLEVDNPLGLGETVEYGLATDAEIAAHEATLRAQERADRDRRERQRRAEYERLKAEFEAKP